MGLKLSDFGEMKHELSRNRTYLTSISDLLYKKKKKKKVFGTYFFTGKNQVLSDK